MPNLTFHTGLYSPKAKSILTAFSRVISQDYGVYTKFYRILNTNMMGGIIISDSGEIMFDASYAPSGYKQDSFLTTLAIKIKDYAIKKFGCIWDRCNTDKCSLTFDISRPNYKEIKAVEFTVRDIYFIYEKLLGRAKAYSRYPKDFIEEIVGKPLDPIISEMRVAQRVEIEKLRQELQVKKDKLTNDMFNERSVMYNAIDSKYSKLKKELEDEYACMIKKIEDEMDALAKR